MKKSTLYAATVTTLLGSTFPGVALADTVFGIYLGAGSWQSEFSGDFNALAGGDIDLESDLGIGDDSTNLLWVALEHPIPLLPNIKLRSTDLKITDTNSINRDITFNGTPIPSGSGISSDLDLAHIDATLYYEILDNWISIDLGLTIRQFDGNVALSGSATPDPVDIDETIPLLYAMGQFDLPFSGFYAGFEVNAIGFESSNVTDLAIKLGYESSLRLGAELGYRTFNVSLEDVNSLDTNIDIGGIYAAVTFHL